jgi:multiple sugar transport system substrate-binding protein
MGKKKISLLIVMMLTLTSCGNQIIIDNRHQITDLEDTQIEEIVVWHTYSEKETEVFEKTVIPLFEKEYSNIKVKSVRQAYNEQLKSALISRASANKTPDIIRMDIVWLPTFAQLNLIHPVSQFHDFMMIKEDLHTEPLQSNLYNGDYYGLPLNTNTKVAIYNQTLLKAVGLQSPPSTMEELIQVIEDTGYKIGISGLSTWEFLPYYYSLGGQLTNASYTKATGYLDSEKSIMALNRLVDLYNKKLLNPRLLSGNAQTWEGIANGDYFMIDEGPWFFSTKSQEETHVITNQTVTVPFPVTNGIASVLGGENLVITKGTEHRDASWTFVKWMTTEVPQQLMLETGLIPTNKNVDLSNLMHKYPYFQPYVESIDNAFLRPPVAKWDRIDEIFSSYMRSIFSGSISVEDGLKSAANEIDQILIENR